MSVVILGGNECMERKYSNVCGKYGYKAKIFCKPCADMKNRIGTPDLLIVFTHTISHKMLRCALPLNRIYSVSLFLITIKVHSWSKTAHKKQKSVVVNIRFGSARQLLAFFGGKAGCMICIYAITW